MTSDNNIFNEYPVNQEDSAEQRGVIAGEVAADEADEETNSVEESSAASLNSGEDNDKSVDSKTVELPFGAETVLKESEKTSRLALTLSALGLLFTMLIIPGIIFSVIGFVYANRLKRNQNSSTVKWAYYIGLIGICTNALVIISTILFILL